MRMTGHKRAYFRGITGLSLYDYDPAENGPECEVITRILASHPHYTPGWEGKVYRFLRLLRETT